MAKVTISGRLVDFIGLILQVDGGQVRQIAHKINISKSQNAASPGLMEGFSAEGLLLDNNGIVNGRIEFSSSVVARLGNIILNQAGSTGGRRQHQPIHVGKEWGAASPLIWSALWTSETVKVFIPRSSHSLKP